MDSYIEEIYELVKKKMAEQAAYSREAYDGLVDETIMYFREKGKLTDDDNEELIKNQLSEMWDDAQEEFTTEE